MANQTTGDNATLSYSLSGTTGSYIPFANIEEIQGNKATAPIVKTTKLDSTAERKQPGLADFGSVKAKVRWLKSLGTLILGWMANKTPIFFQTVVTDPAGSNTGTITASGFVKEFDPFGQLVNNKEVLSDIELEIDGTVTLT